jgi:hypothetical protein
MFIRRSQGADKLKRRAGRSTLCLRCGDSQKRDRSRANKANEYETCDGPPRDHRLPLPG